MHLETLRGTLCNCRWGRDLIKVEATSLAVDELSGDCFFFLLLVVLLLVAGCQLFVWSRQDLTCQLVCCLLHFLAVIIVAFVFVFMVTSIAITRSTVIWRNSHSSQLLPLLALNTQY